MVITRLSIHKRKRKGYDDTSSSFPRAEFVRYKTVAITLLIVTKATKTAEMVSEVLGSHGVSKLILDPVF